jgi:hypothetical protein
MPHLSGHINLDVGEWVLAYALVLQSPAEYAARRGEPNLSHRDCGPLLRNQACDPRPRGILGDPIGSSVRKLPLHFQKYGAPPLDGVLRWSGGFHKGFEQLPTAHT